MIPGLARLTSRLISLPLSLPLLTGRRLRPGVLELVRRGAERVERTAPVHLPFVGDGPLPIVEVDLCGHGPYRFLVDAGANVVSVHERVANEIGLPVVQRTRSRSVRQARTLHLGPAALHHATLVGEPVLDVDGVLGFNLFGEGLLTLDYPQRQLRWIDGALPAGDGHATVSYELRDRMPYVPVHVGEHRIWCNLDTGAQAGLVVPVDTGLDWPLCSPPQAGPTLWNQAEGAIPTRLAQLSSSLWVGSTDLGRPDVLFSPALTGEFLLGSGALQAFAVTFDLGTRRVQLAPAGA